MFLLARNCSASPTPEPPSSSSAKAIVIQDRVDPNTGDMASQLFNFSTNSTVYLGAQEESRMFLPNPKATGLGGMVVLRSRALRLHRCPCRCHHTSAVSWGFAPALLHG